MKKFSIFLYSILFMLMFNLKLGATCLGDPIGKVLDLGGGQGVDSVFVIDNYAFVSLNFNDVRGLAKIDISNPENFKSFLDTEKDNSSYTIDQYLQDIASYTTIYKYGNKFAYFIYYLDPALSEPLDSYIMKVEKTDDNSYIILGYSQNYADNSSFLWTYVAGTNVTKYMDIPNYKIVNYKFEGNNLFILLVDIQDNTHYKVLAFPNAPLTDYFSADISYGITWSDFEIYDYTATPSSSDSFFNVDFYVTYEDNNDYEIDFILSEKDKTSIKLVEFKDSDGLLEKINTEDLTLPLQFNKIIYASCDYIIVSDFDKIYFIKEEENNNFSIISQVQAWDVYNTFIHDNILYVANMGLNIEAIDIGDPYNPYVIDNGTVYAYTTSAFYYNGKVYGSHGWSGLAVYNADTCVSKTTTDYYTNCEEDNSTDFTDNDTTDQCDTGCFTADDVNQITSIWFLAGTGCNITDMSIFNNVKSVWLWDSNTWKIYSSVPEINAILQNYHIDIIKEIPAKKGFWINTQ